MSNGKPKKKRSFSISRLFQSNRFVLIFSLFTAIVLWFVMAINNTENRARVIDDVPIDIKLSDEAVAQDYRIFEQSDATARLSVTGNSIAVNQLTKNDVKVTALSTSSITRAGTYTLNLSASQNSGINDYAFDTIYPSSVVLFVDKYEEKTFDVEQRIKYTVDDSYYAAAPVLSDPKITVSGPETEVSNVDKIVVEKKIDSTLKNSYEFTQNLTLYDRDGQKITNLGHMTLSSGQTSVKIDVLKKAELPVRATFKNFPEGLNLSEIVRVSPEMLQIGSASGEITEVTEITLKPIDMAQVTLDNNSFTTNFELPKGYTNISGIKNATVKFNLEGYTQKTFTVRNFFIVNAPSSIDATVETRQLEVTLVGPAYQLNRLKASDIDVEVDLTDCEDMRGSASVPATVTLDGSYGSWAIGTYTVYANITGAANP